MTTWKRALVTGASSGIGEQIVRQLVAAGVDVVVVARRVERLEELQRELGARVEVLAADLTVTADLDRVAARVSAVDAPIDLLVNNAGYGSFGNVWELPHADAQGQIDLNISALVRLSHAAAGTFADAGFGTILNISSIAGNQPGPRNAVYSATKAFVTSFSEALAVELRGSGVRVTASCPGLTHSEFHEVAGANDAKHSPGFLWMDSATVARDALRAASRGTVVRVNGVGNRALAIAARMSPRFVVRAMATQVTARLGTKD